MRVPRTGEVVDYDAHGYDYRTYWRGREYEEWAESRALSRALRGVGSPGWFADFGGAFGRNAVHYLDRADHAVIMDYSSTNLSNAAKRYPEFVRSGRLHLVRCDLNAIPFRDHTFDAAMVIRVLHHLADLPRGLTEMSRTVAGPWIVDVPIKHHVFGLVRAARGRAWKRIRGGDPLLVGDDEPYWNFHLGAVRDQLRRLGWRPGLTASVNNLRRWDRVLPRPLVPAIRPLAYALELALQRMGRGWWGPSQLVFAQRYDQPSAYQPPGVDRWDLPPAVSALAARMACPCCLRALAWTSREASCNWCCLAFVRRGDFWDFVPDTALVRVRPRSGALAAQPGAPDAQPVAVEPLSTRLWPAPTRRTNQPGLRSHL